MRRGRGAPRSGLVSLLREVARDYQTGAVIPRCETCRNPCCRLDTLVLGLDWPRLRALWGLDESQAAFDQRLARGEGPPEIRADGGMYYAHGIVCPAFRNGRCAVYDTEAKPSGCTDFPVYEEEGRLVADLRCEAVDPDEVEARLLDAFLPPARFRRRPDRRFPFLVRWTVRTG